MKKNTKQNIDKASTIHAGTASIKMWMTDGTYNPITPQDIAAGAEKLINKVQFYNGDMSKEGWTYIGDADVTMHMIDKKTIVDNKVASLKEQAKTIRATATRDCLRIEDQINQLLAIEYTPDGVNHG